MLPSVAVHAPLTALFIDCDSFFASVEQHLDPSLRGKPVGVAPVMAETSCCIAASYEAKKLGIKTGTSVRDARILCPGIRIVESKPSEYVKIHHRVIEAVESCIHVEAVLSIDEMWAWLPTNWREPDFVLELGRSIKETVCREIGNDVKVSVGAAPNKYQAKMATKMGKPDGLFVISSHELPKVLHDLELRDLTGIAKNMEARLHSAGIHTVEALCAAPKQVLHGVWGGVLGNRLWHLLRGDLIPDLVSSRKSIGHSHVLPPDSRTPAKAWPILCKLLHKACERLRSHGMLTGSLTVQLAFLRDVSWAPELRFLETDSTFLLVKHLQRLWSDRPDPRANLIQVGVVLSRFVDSDNHTPDLFQNQMMDAISTDDEKLARLDETIDRLRMRYGRQVVFFGSVQNHRDAAPMRISFTHIPDLALEGDFDPAKK